MLKNTVFIRKKISREKSIELEKGYKNGKRRFSRKRNIYSPKKVERNQLQDWREREREYEMKHPNSCVIIDFRLFDLYKERKLLENKLSEAKELLGHNHNNLVLVWLK